MLNRRIMKNKKTKALLLNILLFGLFPITVAVFAFTANWILFGVTLVIYIAVFILIKLENLMLISAGYFDKKGDNEKALHPAYKAYKLKRSSIDTASIFIFMLLKAGKYEKAMEIISENGSREMDEDQYIAFHSNKALCLWKLNRINEAIAIFDEITKNFESTSIYLSFGTILTFSDDLDKALAVNTKAYKYNSKSKGIKDNLAYTYHLLGDKDRAKRMYEELLGEPVNFPEAYYNAAMVVLAEGQFDEAIRYLKQALTKQFTGLSAITEDDVQKRIDYLNRGQGEIS
jgi:tetratricopeptide (TPR) repeat protein